MAKEESRDVEMVSLPREPSKVDVPMEIVSYKEPEFKPVPESFDRNEPSEKSFEELKEKSEKPLPKPEEIEVYEGADSQ